jgi:PAS domain-containing protein
MRGGAEGSPRSRGDILIGVVIIASWLGVSAYMESVMVNRVPDMAIPGLVWGAPTLVGFVAFAFMLTRVANALTERNVKLAEAEKATARTAAELEAVLESIAVPMMVQNRQGRLVRANRACADLVGANAVGLDFDEIYGPNGLLPVYREDGTPLAKANLPSTRALAGATVNGDTLLVRRGKEDEFFLASCAPVWTPTPGRSPARSPF